MTKVVFSAKRINVSCCDTLGRSLMYKRKRREQRMLPCGTPVSRGLVEEVVSLTGLLLSLSEVGLDKCKHMASYSVMIKLEE